MNYLNWIGIGFILISLVILWKVVPRIIKFYKKEDEFISIGKLPPSKKEAPTTKFHINADDMRLIDDSKPKRKYTKKTIKTEEKPAKKKLIKPLKTKKKA